MNSHNFGCHGSGAAVPRGHESGTHNYVDRNAHIQLYDGTDLISDHGVRFLDDESAIRRKRASIEAAPEIGIVLTAWDMVQKLNQIYCKHLDELIGCRVQALNAHPLYDQMTKNNHITGINGLREILRGDFGMQLMLLILKESEYTTDLDLNFSMLRQDFGKTKILNKNSISTHIHSSLPEGSTKSIRAIQGQVEKTINSMILLDLIEVDTAKSKGKMKALRATATLVDFGCSWCFEAGRLIDAASRGPYQ